MNVNDSVIELKECSVLSSFCLMTLKEKIVILMYFNYWILEDPNLSTNYSKLTEMIDISYKDLEMFVATMKMLDKKGMFFLIGDMKDELMYIKENIELETRYLENMLYYIDAVKNPAIVNIDDIVEICSEFVENDRIFYNQMKINKEGLKMLRKERRDNLE